ncbi:hypothetical protein A2715_02355 [Candidatus Woesebacteria bacterium RIFCSPHIGHO2_01_FULL_39_32]|uniref:Uncharacterized protein n=1 Tax=Candidatus Woesebacteria bacterium RIFCSPLOWO2_01_FULL_39_25 TaxID=1802521 RepID=A0A1F8BJD8_9BACT|nr:MAG: hypothetical protein A2124_01765 [Candidatus Woesebacteria bacterium GWB1_37_5]OGM23992.1 MAG: hypothetical protein A2715_02355 [Candidatus Woesebacteria bacterium RIFCSPHIGHO2_01_FULL_39_32]OGM37498.1 MAG: hypothetical protein A3F01_03590 [Candidatus Woesebacteria bacterium RIFCSPHIGHO2_12_FULL_38_11]OGM64181.1 MAG: hypothetical protein A2893_03595 [Candidatus Woesebacteria bacterium RIFCSPLOWO2_01_FULL_39_25]
MSERQGTPEESRVYIVKTDGSEVWVKPDTLGQGATRSITEHASEVRSTEVATQPTKPSTP